MCLHYASSPRSGPSAYRLRSYVPVSSCPLRPHCARLPSQWQGLGICGLVQCSLAASQLRNGVPTSLPLYRVLARTCAQVYTLKIRNTGLGPIVLERCTLRVTYFGTIARGPMRERLPKGQPLGLLLIRPIEGLTQGWC